MKTTFKKYSIAFLVILGLTPMIGANDFTDQTLKQVEEHVEKLLGNGFTAEQILLVLDVDGTLTNYSDPDDHKNDKPFGARGNATNFVTGMVNSGVQVVVSSAWDKFEDTLGRLEKIGLSEALNVNRNDIKCNNDELELNNKIFKLNYCKVGFVASVMDVDFNSIFYRQKAFAFKYVYPEMDMTQIKHVVFADDSGGNIKIFKEDIERSQLFPMAHIDTFLLSLAEGQPDLE